MRSLPSLEAIDHRHMAVATWPTCVNSYEPCLLVNPLACMSVRGYAVIAECYSLYSAGPAENCNFKRKKNAKKCNVITLKIAKKNATSEGAYN